MGRHDDALNAPRNIMRSFHANGTRTREPVTLVRCPPNFYGGTMWCWCNSVASLNSWWSGLGASAGAAAGALQGARASSGGAAGAVQGAAVSLPDTGALPPKFLWRHHVVLVQQHGEFELLVVWSRCIGRRRRRRSSGCKQARKKCDSAGVPMLGGLREPVTTIPTILLH